MLLGLYIDLMTEFFYRVRFNEPLCIAFRDDVIPKPLLVSFVLLTTYNLNTNSSEFSSAAAAI